MSEEKKLVTVLSIEEGEIKPRVKDAFEHLGDGLWPRYAEYLESCPNPLSFKDWRRLFADEGPEVG